jgi:phosphatidylethanolamine/phosphatidyl-N-methylethanolamine N-methyltransferase
MKPATGKSTRYRKFFSAPSIIAFMQIDAVKAAYRRYAGFYNALFGPVLQPGRKAVIEALDCQPGHRVLEVGVGTGLALDLYPAGVKVVGIDVSAEMLDKARRRVAKRGFTHVEALLEMDAEAMSFADASFDRIVAMYVLPVVPNPARLLAELHRVCKPDGEIYLVNHVRSDNPVIGAVEKGLARFSDKLGFHPDFELRGVLNGHELVQIERVNLFWKVMQLRNGVSRSL